MRGGHRRQLHGHRIVKGKTIDEALAVSNKAVADAPVGLPPIKMHCSLLADKVLSTEAMCSFARERQDRLPQYETDHVGENPVAPAGDATRGCVAAGNHL